MSETKFTAAMAAIVIVVAITIVAGNATWIGAIIGISVLVIVVAAIVGLAGF
ncbi:hypothetical protein [Bradyrhizobium sp. JYMT SZCCT0428]|uniref:hypothetical protein n=1 Tax=Bradyrhizobium sp. JYMT SZCCT0428 TaxID=2807673 RepID=UPI001BA893C6|nr:hypothetical protein [Bradyrhizobium sp. JYMT SZCCT0428]MBR1150064.1 hypothetical protein [Bradyrhizobium sp. JYMT SZCCT0428]